MTATLEISPLVETREYSLRELKEEKLRRNLKNSFDAFFRMHPPGEHYVYGKFYRELTSLLDGVTKDVEEGLCRYICICLPVRHGKSDLVDRRWLPWNIFRNPHWEQLLAGYNYTLVSGMSHDVRGLVQDVGPWYGVQVQQDRGALESWSIADFGGKLHVTGIGGTVTGRGAVMLVVDDAFKNRKEAESLTIRQAKWEAFESDLLTRLAPAHAVVIVNNRWHPDDIVGRIEDKNDPDHEDYDSEFPIFEQHVYPAQSEDGEWLLPERFSDSWYRSLRAFLGTYAWNSQGLQRPVNRGGNLFDLSGIVEVPLSTFPSTKYARFWDLASTEKERVGHNPSWTVGALGTVEKEQDDVLPGLWISDLVFCREEAPKRDKLIRATAQKDGAAVPILVEAVAGYKDAYTTLRAILRGKRLVRKVNVSKDKVTNASVLEPLFEAKRIYVPEGASWLPFFRRHFAVFPAAPNDAVDSTVGVYRHLIKRVSLGNLQGLSREALGI